MSKRKIADRILDKAEKELERGFTWNICVVFDKARETSICRLHRVSASRVGDAVGLLVGLAEIAARGVSLAVLWLVTVLLVIALILPLLIYGLYYGFRDLAIWRAIRKNPRYPKLYDRWLELQEEHSRQRYKQPDEEPKQQEQENGD